MTGEWDFRGIDAGEELPDIDTSAPHSARIYDYILGGKDNFAVDRQAAAKAMAANPHLAMAMRENRGKVTTNTVGPWATIPGGTGWAPGGRARAPG